MNSKSQIMDSESLSAGKDLRYIFNLLLNLMPFPVLASLIKLSQPHPFLHTQNKR